MKTGAWPRGAVTGGVAMVVALAVTGVRAQEDRRDAPTTQPARSGRALPEPLPPRPEPSAEEVLRALEPREGTPRPIVRPAEPGESVRRTLAPQGRPRNAIVPVETRLLPDGYRMVDRPGRLAREGDYWVLAFESRGTQTAEPPIRLLPNRMLEDMEIASAGGTQPVVFLVSGEVTQYHGVNYLLVQKLLVRPNLGNLK